MPVAQLERAVQQCLVTADTRRGDPNPRAHRLPGTWWVYPQVKLPDVQSGDRPPDQHPLDLRRARENGEDPGDRGSLCRSAACSTRGISTDSARPVRDEFRFLVGPARDWRAGRRRASVGGRGRPVSWRTPSAGYSATGTSQVHSGADLRLSRRSRYRPRVRGADRPDAGRTPGECPEPRAGRCHADTAASPAGQAIHASAGDYALWR